MTLPDRPYTILLCAMGGEGGAGIEPMAAKGARILCEWIVRAAHAAGYPVQSTLTPGTGQRTGLNSLYIEIYPVTTANLEGRRPVFRLAPRPGDVDLLVAYELLEAGRAMTQGLVSSDRTTLIASTHRFYTFAEKGPATDGRVDSGAIIEAAKASAKAAVLLDMAEIGATTGGSVNAVAAGALTALASFPVDATHVEKAVSEIGDGINSGLANLDAYAAGQEAGKASNGELPRPPTKRRRTPLAALRKRIADDYPEILQQIVHQATARIADFQNVSYARVFLDRLGRIRALDDGGSAADYALTRETARYLALWMSYDDVIRVADLKTRPDRMARIRLEVGADPDQPLRLTEFFKPGLDEWTAILPVPLGRVLRRFATQFSLRQRLNVGLRIRSSAIWGFLLLRLIASLRFLRPLSLGLAEETAYIDRWLAAIRQAAARDYRLAVEIAECGRLIKGYGETRARSYNNFARVFAKLIDPALDGRLHHDIAGPALGRARAAAFADPEDDTFERRLDEITAATNGDLTAAETGTPIR